MLITLALVLEISPVIANTIGFVVGALINYQLNYRITFNSNKAYRETLTCFVIAATPSTFINTTIMAAGAARYHLHYIIIQLDATGAALALNFIANKYWTFAS